MILHQVIRIITPPPTCPVPVPRHSTRVWEKKQKLVALFSAHLMRFVLRYGKNGGNFTVFVRCTRATTSCVVESVKAGVGVQVQYIQKTFVVVFSVKTRSLLSLRYLAESASAERKLSSSIREVARSYRRLSPHPLNTVCVSRPRKASSTCFLFLFCCLFGLGDGASSWWEVPTWEEDWQWLIWGHLLG